jgi:hypothetical protein
MDNQTNSGMDKNAAMKFITPAIAVLVLAGAAIWMSNKPVATAPSEQTPSDTSGEQNTPTPTPSTPETPAPVVSQSYKAGSYGATGTYQSPAGAEELGVTLTINQAGIITDAKSETMATNPASKKWQGVFTAGVNTEVVGKSIDQVSLGVVSGSSLTPKGFMDALEKIKVQAIAS